METKKFSQSLSLDEAQALAKVLSFFLEVRQAGDEIKHFNFTSGILAVWLDNDISLEFDINEPNKGVRIFGRNEFGNYSESFSYQEAVNELNKYKQSNK